MSRDASDKGDIVGIEEDFEFVGGKDVDGWELWLTCAVDTSMGKVAATELDIAYCDFDGRTVAKISVGPSPRPVFALHPKGEKRQRFLARTNNSTEELEGEELLDYKARRWPE